MKKIALLLPLLFLFYAPFSSAGELKTRYTDNQLINILKAEGYSAVSQVKESVILVKIDGRNYVVINQDDGDLQFYYGLAGSRLTYEEINEWNKNKRLSRAYIDDENDPVLEADLMANGGISDEHIAVSFKVFVMSAKQFAEFVSNYDN